MKSRYDVVILGAGLAGLCAARTLSGHGFSILVAEESLHKGGQLLRKMPGSPVRGWNVDSLKSKGFNLIKDVEQHRDIDWTFSTQVSGIYPDNCLLLNVMDTDHPGQSRLAQVHAGTMILATGARETFLPFKGWTLPGVMSLGAAQVLMKSHGVLPGANTFIAGTSPLMMALSWEIIKNGGGVSGLADENRLSDQAAFLPLAARHWPKLFEGTAYLANLMRHRIPVYRGWRVVEATGDTQFNTAVIARTDKDGRVVSGTAKTVTGDALAFGNGFVPNLELCAQAGCRISYNAGLGGWKADVDDRCETSLASVFAAGEITGIAGGKKSMLEGELAALAVLVRLSNGKPRIKDISGRIEKLQAGIRAQQDYAVFFNRLCRVPDAAWAGIEDDVVICRCENITMGQIRNAVAHGFTTPGGIKKFTRAGMGPCQGRTCSRIIQDIVCALTGRAPADMPMVHPRTPVKNLGVSAFLGPMENGAKE